MLYIDDMYTRKYKYKRLNTHIDLTLKVTYLFASCAFQIRTSETLNHKRKTMINFLSQMKSLLCFLFHQVTSTIKYYAKSSPYIFILKKKSSLF